MTLEAEVKDVLDKTNLALIASVNENWTRAIKSNLAKLGRERQFWVYASGADNTHGGEWLYDLCWLKYAEEYFINVELALECEWLSGGEHVFDDFLKLCQCRATLRVMIYAAWTFEHSRPLTDRLKNQIRCCDSSVDGDRYLLSCWINETGKFHHESISHMAT